MCVFLILPEAILKSCPVARFKTYKRKTETASCCWSVALCDPVNPSPPCSCSWGFPGKGAGAGCHFLHQGIFLTRELNPHLLYWQADSLPLSHQGGPRQPGFALILCFDIWSAFFWNINLFMSQSSPVRFHGWRFVFKEFRKFIQGHTGTSDQNQNGHPASSDFCPGDFPIASHSLCVVASEDVHVLIPWLSDGYFVWQKGLRRLKKALGCRASPGLYVWAQWNPKSRREGVCRVRGGRVMREAGVGHWLRGWGRAGWAEREWGWETEGSQAAGVEMVRRVLSRGWQAASRTWKGRKMLLTGVSEGTQLCCHLASARSEPFWTFNLQNCKIIHLCCFTSLSL